MYDGMNHLVKCHLQASEKAFLIAIGVACNQIHVCCLKELNYELCHIKVFCINYSNCNRNEEPYSRKQLYLLLWPKFCYNHEHLSIKNLDGLIKEVQGIVILRECSSCLK